MKQVIVIVLALLGQSLVSCNKESALSASSTLPAQIASTQLTLLENNWQSSEAVMVPYYGDSTFRWFGNQVFPVSINFNENGTSITYNSIDLTDDQWYDTCAYRLLPDGSTLLFYPISGGFQQAKADTAKIGVINDSTLVLYYFGTKTPCVADAFYK
jgi:hypothetical protein